MKKEKKNKSGKPNDGHPPKMKLECLASYNVMSLGAVGFPGSQQDTILMSSAHAKLILIQYFEGKIYACLYLRNNFTLEYFFLIRAT